jgi:hypothetical protein
MLLALEGGKATHQARLDTAYEKFDDEFPQASACTKRVTDVMEVLDRVFDDRASVDRLTKRMWVYSLFDAIQQVRLGGPIEGPKAPKKKISLKKLRQVASGLNAELKSGEIPEDLGKAIRGAANDKQSRDVRAGYLTRRLMD